MEALAKLSDELGNPGVAKLHLEAKRRKIRVSKAQVQDLVKRQGARQLFQPVQKSAGKSASESYSARYQADLADMSTTPSRGFKYVLILVNVYSREVSAEALKSKEPTAVAPALKRLIEKLPEKTTTKKKHNQTKNKKNNKPNKNKTNKHQTKKQTKPAQQKQTQTN